MKGTASSNPDFVNFSSRKNVSALCKVHILLKMNPFKGTEMNDLPEQNISVRRTPKNQQVGRKNVFMLDYTEYSQEGFMHRENSWFYALSFWDMCFS